MLRHSMSRWHLGGKNLRKSGLLLTVIFTLVFSLAPLAHAQDTDDDEDGHDSQARIVRLSYVEGQVRLDNGHGYESATLNVPITQGNWLQTASDGWAEVQLEDGSMIRMAPDTVVAFTDLSRASSGGTMTTVDLDQGEAEFKIIKHDGSDFQVTVKKNTIALTHSGTFRVLSTNANPLELAVFKGEVSVRDGEGGDGVAVQKNETFVLNPNDVGQYALDKGTDADDLDQWSKQRDDYLGTYASAGPGYAQSPYQYGANDLNYYGQYYDVPGYGEVWQPNNVGLSWDPFSNGYWSYSPGFGYTWVSSYPWGWMPYRYGRWVFVSGRGWCWAPGGWNRWYSRPRWANAPPGFHAPTPPADRRVVDRNPGHINHPGGAIDNRGPIGRGPGPGGRVADRDDNNGNAGRSGGSRDGRRVFTNDDVQSRVPRTDVPAQPHALTPDDADRRPKVVDRQPEGGAGDRGGNLDRGRGERDTPREPIRRSNNDSSPAVTERQHTPPPQSYSPPPSRQPEHQYTPPPASVHTQQSAPPSAPAVHQSAPPPAPVQHQASPPPESHARSSDDGGGRPKNR
jgi:hypothetical protein